MNYIENDDLFQVRKLDKYMEGHKGFIAGGCFKNIFEKKAFKDVDIFFEKMEDFKKALELFTADQEFVKLYENDNSVCFKRKDRAVQVDLIRSVFGTPEEIISKFDFTIAKFAYHKHDKGDSITYKCLYHPKFFEHLVVKRLVIDDQIPFPVGTFERSFRYRGYGYGLCRESKAKLINALQGESTDNLSMDLYFGFD